MTFREGKHLRGRVTFNGHSGTNTVRFYGRLNKHRELPTCRYTLSIVARSAGKRPRTVKLRFTML